jgi:nucleoside-diphosphate-sugar epimerase
VIPTIITQLVASAREVKLGEVRTTRDFTFVAVADTCRALLSLAQLDGGAGEVFNIGSNDEIAIGDLVAVIGNLMGVPAPDADERIVRGDGDGRQGKGYYDTDQTMFYSINPAGYCNVSRLFEISVVGVGLIGGGTRHVLDRMWSLE